MLFLQCFILFTFDENEKVYFTAAQPVTSAPSNQLKQTKKQKPNHSHFSGLKKRLKRKTKSIHVVTVYLESYCPQPLI